MACSLTGRDREILRLLRRHPVLTTSQVHRCFFTNRNTAQHRLTRLCQLRLVDRFRDRPRSGSQLGEGEYYVLDRLGAALVRWEHNPHVDLASIRWRTDWVRSIGEQPAARAHRRGRRVHPAARRRSRRPRRRAGDLWG